MHHADPALLTIAWAAVAGLLAQGLRHRMRGPPIVPLLAIGVLVTWAGATLAAWGIAGLSVPVAIVFGALVTVTGPTVVQPLLRRVPLPRHVKTVLEGEAI